MSEAVHFDDGFRAQLRELFIWRRDVRRFRREALPTGTTERLIEVACLSPSVGFSQPWRFVIVDSPTRRAAVRAVFADRETPTGHGLGRATMPEMIEYSAVAAVCTLWLAARAEGIGMGWVSILDPGRVSEILEVPADWRLIGYFCLGYPQADSDHPELERTGWEERQPLQVCVLHR